MYGCIIEKEQVPAHQGYIDIAKRCFIKDRPGQIVAQNNFSQSDICCIQNIARGTRRVETQRKRKELTEGEAKTQSRRLAVQQQKIVDLAAKIGEKMKGTQR